MLYHVIPCVISCYTMCCIMLHHVISCDIPINHTNVSVSNTVPSHVPGQAHDDRGRVQPLVQAEMMVMEKLLAELSGGYKNFDSTKAIIQYNLMTNVTI